MSRGRPPKITDLLLVAIADRLNEPTKVILKALGISRTTLWKARKRISEHNKMFLKHQIDSQDAPSRSHT